MSDVSEVEAQLPLEGVGVRLLRAREASGMSRSQLATKTKIPERHLAAIESGDFAALPARTYAIGFSRSYAKALGLDDKAIVEEVRSELAALDPAPVRATPAFEPGDPARVPAARFAWIAALAALLVIIAGFAFAWRGYYLPGGSLPSLLPEEAAAPESAQASGNREATPAPAAPAGPVVFTSEQQGVWVKFYDANGNQLLQKQLAQGESWTVPEGLPDVKIWTARPDALAITIGGQPVPKLSDVQKTIKDVPVSAAALLARGVPAAMPASTDASAPAGAAPRRAPMPVPQRRRIEAAPAEAPVAAAPVQSPGASPRPGSATPVPTPAPVAPAT